MSLENIVEMMRNSLQNENPILFLGAGFSLGAFADGHELPKAENLKQGIFNEFYIDKCPNAITDEEKEEIKGLDLAQLCAAIKNENREHELNKYLVRIFKNAHPNEADPFHTLIVDYYWDRIYTLNIDDLVENIYTSKGVEFVVQNETTRKDAHKKREIIKLHGCVNNPEKGFIFSSDEYTSNIAQADFRLKSFGTDYFTHDIIFVGTEFNEADIHVLLRQNMQSGFESKYHKYFFVTPTIKYQLKSLINKQYNL